MSLFRFCRSWKHTWGLVLGSASLFTSFLDLSSLLNLPESLQSRTWGDDSTHFTASLGELSEVICRVLNVLHSSVRGKRLLSCWVPLLITPAFLGLLPSVASEIFLLLCFPQVSLTQWLSLLPASSSVCLFSAGIPPVRVIFCLHALDNLSHSQDLSCHLSVCWQLPHGYLQPRPFSWAPLKGTSYPASRARQGTQWP